MHLSIHVNGNEIDTFPIVIEPHGGKPVIGEYSGDLLEVVNFLCLGVEVFVTNLFKFHVVNFPSSSHRPEFQC
jgi:hypothetical protein